MKPKTEKKIIQVLSGVLFFMILCLGLFLDLHRDQVYAAVYSARLIKRPEPFTEMYFNNYTAFPKQSVSGMRFSYSFTIHNMEVATSAYQYSTYFEYPNGFKVGMGEGTITLHSLEYYVATTTYTFKNSNLHGKVVVDLLGRDQHIDFLLPDVNQ